MAYDEDHVGAAARRVCLLMRHDMSRAISSDRALLSTCRAIPCVWGPSPSAFFSLQSSTFHRLSFLHRLEAQQSGGDNMESTFMFLGFLNSNPLHHIRRRFCLFRTSSLACSTAEDPTYLGQVSHERSKQCILHNSSLHLDRNWSRAARPQKAVYRMSVVLSKIVISS